MEADTPRLVTSLAKFQEAVAVALHVSERTQDSGFLDRLALTLDQHTEELETWSAPLLNASFAPRATTPAQSAEELLVAITALKERFGQSVQLEPLEHNSVEHTRKLQQQRAVLEARVRQEEQRMVIMIKRLRALWEGAGVALAEYKLLDLEYIPKHSLRTVINASPHTWMLDQHTVAEVKLLLFKWHNHELRFKQNPKPLLWQLPADLRLLCLSWLFPPHSTAPDQVHKATTEALHCIARVSAVCRSCYSVSAHEPWLTIPEQVALDAVLSRPWSQHHHEWVVKCCRICAICHTCTGYGTDCCESANVCSNPECIKGCICGRICGCGSGCPGCNVCGVCKKCVMAGHTSKCDVSLQVGTVASYDHLMQLLSPVLVWANTLETRRNTVGEHEWTDRKECRVCVKCRQCTGYGQSCCNYELGALESRELGAECGCGIGDCGCVNCGMCKWCIEAGAQSRCSVGYDTLLEDKISQPRCEVNLIRRLHCWITYRAHLKEIGPAVSLDGTSDVVLEESSGGEWSDVDDASFEAESGEDF